MIIFRRHINSILENHIDCVNGPLRPRFEISKNYSKDCERYRNWFYRNLEKSKQMQDYLNKLADLYIKYGNLYLYGWTDSSHGYLSVIRDAIVDILSQRNCYRKYKNYGASY